MKLRTRRHLALIATVGALGLIGPGVASAHDTPGDTAATGPTAPAPAGTGLLSSDPADASAQVPSPAPAAGTAPVPPVSGAGADPVTGPAPVAGAAAPGVAAAVPVAAPVADPTAPPAGGTVAGPGGIAVQEPPGVPPAVTPPVVAPPATVPPATVPPATVPPATVPPATVPPATVPPVAVPPVPAEPDTAAEKYGWGTPLPESDEFDYTGAPDSAKWDTINGCWAGHNGNGKRCGANSTVDGEKLIQKGSENGDTGWLASKLDQRYGRWEARVRSFNTGDSGKEYHPLLIVWPESDSWPEDGEYDFLENQAPGEECANAFIHYPHPNMPVQQEFLEEEDCGAPLSEWHNIAFEWTPDHVRGYVDGKEWYTLEDGAGPGGRKNIQDMPSGHLTIQFDNFHGGGMREASYEIDWVRMYSLDGAGQPAAGAPGTAAGAPAAGGEDRSGEDPSTGDSSGGRSSGGRSSAEKPSGGDPSGDGPASEGAMTEAAPAASATRASSFDARTSG
ncbi:glycoside hydrolase family 16 protein [Pseudonocardia halophobica]|uniref:glycoside hydrolase family 16 protein n=1 Tax=Pseudonocardia halophobica TaxID=29401 RepID=UPI0031E19467